MVGRFLSFPPPPEWIPAIKQNITIRRLGKLETETTQNVSFVLEKFISYTF